MVQLAAQHLRGQHQAQEALFGEVPKLPRRRLVLECDCRARLILDSAEALWHLERLGHECRICRVRWRQWELRVPKKKHQEHYAPLEE